MANTLSYTGERLVPGNASLENLLVEDLAKFHFAAQYASGRDVLDAGCGAGQGSAYLAQNGARSVTAVDISSEAVAYAKAHYPVENLRFSVMDVVTLGFSAECFEMVTSIEVIEHLHNPEQYIAGIRRVLTPTGILVLSTPNKLISSPQAGMVWPYHIHEFLPQELAVLLQRYFSSVELLGLWIPVYDQHPLRRLMHWFAPFFKPRLPVALRTRALPALQKTIKKRLELTDVQIVADAVEQKSTLIAVCRV